jgi:hypothetical protein
VGQYLFLVLTDFNLLCFQLNSISVLYGPPCSVDVEYVCQGSSLLSSVSSRNVCVKFRDYEVSSANTQADRLSSCIYCVNDNMLMDDTDSDVCAAESYFVLL